MFAIKNNNRHRRSFKPALEMLEDRCVLSTFLLIDFDGSTQAEGDTLYNTVWSNEGVKAQATRLGFTQGFEAYGILNSNYAKFQFLDYNDDLTFDRADGELAARNILQKVREDFAPYDVNVLREDNTSLAIDRVVGNAGKDAIILVSGWLGTGGQAPYDADNTSDNAGEVNGLLGNAIMLADLGWAGRDARDALENILANAISHEAGHTFGLDHVGEHLLDRGAVSIMTPGVGVIDLSFTDDFFFVDDQGKWIEENAGRQNAHEYLTDTLGASSRPWATVNSAGWLTIQGSSMSDQVSVYRVVARSSTTAAPKEDWIVSIGYMDRYQVWNSTTYRINPYADTRVDASNSFGKAIWYIHFYGGNGNDYLNVDAGIQATVYAYGESGTDTLIGGGGNDVLSGGTEVDYLYGNEGWDTLSGGAGKDHLFGGRGSDSLFGGDHDDYMDGGEGDDILVGGAGTDTMLGGADRDILIGEGGADIMRGGSGDDILIGGYYTGVADYSKLTGLRTKWTASTSVTSRKTALRGDLNSLTVIEDNLDDQMLGEGDSDWYFGW